MKMILLYLTLLSMLIAQGCNKIKEQACNAQGLVEQAITTAIATGLNCKNKGAVTTDVLAQAHKLSLCDKSQQKFKIKGPDVDERDMCGILVPFLSDFAFKQGIPTAWECDGGVTKDVVTNLVVTACKGVFKL